MIPCLKVIRTLTFRIHENIGHKNNKYNFKNAQNMSDQCLIANTLVEY